MMAQVVKCYFCGGSKLRYIPVGGKMTIQCLRCGATGPKASNTSENPKEEALALWNRRYMPNEPRRTGAEIKAKDGTDKEPERKTPKQRYYESKREASDKTEASQKQEPKPKAETKQKPKAAPKPKPEPKRSTVERRICAECGQPFLVGGPYGNSPRAKYCSIVCKKRRDSRVEREKDMAKRMEGHSGFATCKHCGKVYRVGLPGQRRINSRYCSKECKEKHNDALKLERKKEAREANLAEISCGWCGKPFTPGEEGGRGKGSKYCSVECSRKANDAMSNAVKRAKNAENASEHPTVTTKCSVCGKDFERPRGKRIQVCSEECAAERRRGYMRTYMERKRA